MTGNKNRADKNINEEMMMNLMVDGVRKDGLSLPSENEGVQQNHTEHRQEKLEERKEKTRTKKNNIGDYESLFFARPDTNARDGKTVYIRPDYHEKLSRIVQVIGEDKITIYAYLDNVLSYHFSEFGDDIVKSFNNKYKPIL